MSLIEIPENSFQQIQVFLNQFPNLCFLHIHICNRSITDEYLLIQLNEIIRKFHSLIYLKLQLGKAVNSSFDWNEEFNGRVKMHLSDNIFDGVLIHLWF